MDAKKRKTNSFQIDEYDWAELFTQFRENASDPRVARVRRILELLTLAPRAEGASRLRVFTELNARVREYQWHTHLSPSAQGIIEILRTPPELPGAKKWEYRAVRWLLNLFHRRGELDLVHLCEMNEKRPECTGWFYGRPNKRFCSAACKQYHYDSGDEVKARRAKNAEHNRAHRRNVKRQEDKAKRDVGFTGSHRIRSGKSAR